MWDQEKEHLKKFEQIVAERRVRPTALIPLWNIAGYVLGIVDVSVRNIEMSRNLQISHKPFMII